MVTSNVISYDKWFVLIIIIVIIIIINPVDQKPYLERNSHSIKNPYFTKHKRSLQCSQDAESPYPEPPTHDTL